MACARLCVIAVPDPVCGDVDRVFVEKALGEIHLKIVLPSIPAEMRANSKTGGAPGNRGLRVSCDYNQGFSAFLSVSADVGWVIARAVWPQEGAQVQLQFEPSRRSEGEETGSGSMLVPPERSGLDKRLYCSPRRDFGDRDRDGHQVVTPQNA